MCIFCTLGIPFGGAPGIRSYNLGEADTSITSVMAAPDLIIDNYITITSVSLNVSHEQRRTQQCVDPLHIIIITIIIIIIKTLGY